MKLTITSLLASIAILFTPGSVSALAPLQYNDVTSLLGIKQDDKLVKPFLTENFGAPVVAKVEPSKPKTYTVAAGDNLSKIGTAYNVEWQRLWAKNTQLKHPDLIYVGTKITIPEPSERLKRALPAVVTLPKETPGVAPLRAYDASNSYDYGYCTWYVKNRRGASLPNGLGNANTWYARAAGSGLSVGRIPKAGAVGATTRGSLGHVVFVESVNKDGSVNISEMNYKGFGVQSSRTAPASEFVYIY